MRKASPNPAKTITILNTLAKLLNDWSPSSAIESASRGYRNMRNSERNATCCQLDLVGGGKNWKSLRMYAANANPKIEQIPTNEIENKAHINGGGRSMRFRFTTLRPHYTLQLFSVPSALAPLWLPQISKTVRRAALQQPDRAKRIH